MNRRLSRSENLFPQVYIKHRKAGTEMIEKRKKTSIRQRTDLDNTEKGARGKEKK